MFRGIVSTLLLLLDSLLGLFNLLRRGNRSHSPRIARLRQLGCLLPTSFKHAPSTHQSSHYTQTATSQRHFEGAHLSRSCCSWAAAERSAMACFRPALAFVAAGWRRDLERLPLRAGLRLSSGFLGAFLETESDAGCRLGDDDRGRESGNGLSRFKSSSKRIPSS